LSDVESIEDSRIKWVPRPNLHLTLRFFGSVISEEKMFRAATDVITDVVSNMEPFELELKTVGVFPKWDKPRVVNFKLNSEHLPLITTKQKEK
jgi:2'-5' RNA ligase